MAEGNTTSEAGAWRLVPALAAALASIWFAGFIAPVARGEIPELVLQWVPALGIEFAFRLDGLALAFALLICGIGALVFLYAATYFRRDRRLGSLLLTLIVFAVSMLGMVVADDAITFFVFWEGTTITSWLLVGFDHERASARAAALQARQRGPVGLYTSPHLKSFAERIQVDGVPVAELAIPVSWPMVSQVLPLKPSVSKVLALPLVPWPLYQKLMLVAGPAKVALTS